MIDTRNSAAGDRFEDQPRASCDAECPQQWSADVLRRVALKLHLRALGNRADCLVVDYKMAELDGLELAYRLRRLDVSTPIILITGYPDENIAAKASSAGVRQVLLKPNLEDNLVDCVRNAIDAPDAAGQP